MDSGSKMNIMLLWFVNKSNLVGNATRQCKRSKVARTTKASFTNVDQPSCVGVNLTKWNASGSCDESLCGSDGDCEGTCVANPDQCV